MSDPEILAAALAAVLPSVGAFGACMDALDGSGLADTARAFAASGRPFLGICVGMQLLYDASEDAGPHGPVHPRRHRPACSRGQVKRPQMQWNRLVASEPPPADVEPTASGYFVHSYAAPLEDDVIATCEYGGPVTAAGGAKQRVGRSVPPREVEEAELALLANFVAHVKASQAPMPIAEEVDEGHRVIRAWTSTLAAGQEASASSGPACDARRSVELAAATTPRVPTSWCSSTSRPAPTPATRSSTSSRTDREEVFIPFTIGGGIPVGRAAPTAPGRCRQGGDQHRSGRTLEADRPSWPPSSAASASSCRSTRRGDTPSRFEVVVHGGRTPTGLDTLEWAARAVALKPTRSC
ncbi:MAG: hypothetical protein R2704_09970 [Microthrixaceae bacterium]